MKEVKEEVKEEGDKTGWVVDMRLADGNSGGKRERERERAGQ